MRRKFCSRSCAASYNNSSTVAPKKRAKPRFCADCGAPIFSRTTAEPPGYSLRVGTLDERAELLPARQIWCRSALPWAMDLTGVAQAERQ